MQDQLPAEKKKAGKKPTDEKTVCCFTFLDVHHKMIFTYAMSLLYLVLVRITSVVTFYALCDAYSGIDICYWKHRYQQLTKPLLKFLCQYRTKLAIRFKRLAIGFYDLWYRIIF